MPLETATKPVDLNPLWPLGSDSKSEGDDHLRMIKTVIQNLMPVGSIIINTTGTNPADIWGGTWEQIAQGRAIVGVGDNGETTWAQGDQRGSETHQLTADEVPAHTHGAGTLTTDDPGNHTHSESYVRAQSGVGWGDGLGLTTGTRATGPGGAHTHTILGDTASAGGDQPHNNLQPSEAHYVWERTG